MVIKVGLNDLNHLFICSNDYVFVTDVFNYPVLVAINKEEHALG
jgi:hypothetical protein